MGVFMISFENEGRDYLEDRMNIIFDHYTSSRIDPLFKTITFDKVVHYLELIGTRKTVGRIVAVR
jgi:hypothetical protein